MRTMLGTPIRTAAAVIACAGSLGFVVGALPPTQGVADAATSERFWSTLRLHGAAEVEHFDTLAAMADSSDLVVVGSFGNMRISRHIPTDSPENIITYAVADVVVERAIRGNVPSARLPVEFLVPMTSPEAAQEAIASQQSHLPKGQALMFLRHKGGAEKGLYRLVNTAGLWIETASGLQAPLTEERQFGQSLPPLTENQVARQLSEDQAARDGALQQGKVSDFAGLTAVSPRQLAPATEDHVDEPPSPAEKYAAELAGLRSLADLAASLK